jgi:hypothetical protein
MLHSHSEKRPINRPYYRSSITLGKEKCQATFKHEAAIGFGALFSNIMGKIMSFA